MSVIIPAKTKTYQYMYNILVPPPYSEAVTRGVLCNLPIMWFDYKKAFDSVPYD